MKGIVLPESKSESAALLHISTDENRVRFAALCGMNLGEGGSPRAQGSLVVNTHARRYEGSDWSSAVVTQAGDRVVLRHTSLDGDVEVTSTWVADAVSGVVSRQDELTNKGSAAVNIQRCLTRITLPSSYYEVYAQQSRWCNENQGAWQPLHAGDLTLRCVSGRTTQGGTPYACIRDIQSRHALALHVLPCGNWVIRFHLIASGDTVPAVVVELGLADENLHVPLQPGESLALPELLFQQLPQGEPHLAAPYLHQYLLARHFSTAKPQAPVVYNTWFDQFEVLDVPRLRRQLAAAKAMGCEAFVIDAGWYGAGDANWWAQAGDWREKQKAAFHGRMREFADEVRAAGLGFGLWMEPERIGADTPIYAEHPEWFVPVGAAARLDLANPAAYGWLRGEIGRLVETYDLAWMKLDFNFDLDYDAAGLEISGYSALLYQMLDDIRAAYPNTFFEGCASGALRMDISTLSHVDGHFLSDSVEPVDTLRIAQGAYLRLPPGRATRWAVLRSPGKATPRYTMREEDSPDTVLVAGGALWEPAYSVDLDFAVLAAMPGMLGFSGDPAGMPSAVVSRIGEHVAFYKQWRRLIVGAQAHLLTPPEPITSRSGWVATQFQNPEDATSLLFVYRLGVAPQAPRLALRGLRTDARYAVHRALTDRAEPIVMSGAELMTTGITPDLPSVGGSRTNAAAVYIVREIGD